ncbi:protease inhibitor Inh/omp19 family protein [Notoacmeibacter marinus]|uniref:protease inhibitor Inh/omp19 family protein n=1 Tax=Notoacmeibacter marinus TaxID=1876515 RepID=UPI001FDF89B3|nr:protease inhibitor Inh/omp19 family protein [Notoacmeibacter marinus]
MIFNRCGGARAPLVLTIAVGVAALALSGCTSSRFDGAYNQPAASSAPQLLQPAPVQTVQSNQLPPPVDPATAAQNADALGTAPDGSVDVAAVSPTPGSSPSVSAAGAPISKGEVVGNWKTQAGGANCQMFLTLTKYGSASRGGTRGCSGDLANLRGWDVKGSQLVLYDESGGTIGRLYGAGPGRYSGQTSSGTPVTLSR